MEFSTPSPGVGQINNIVLEKEFYRQRLPHLVPKKATFFITFRLYGSIPVTEIKELSKKYFYEKRKIENSLREDKELLLWRTHTEFFSEYERLLEKISFGPKHLGKKRIAEVLCQKFHQYDQKLYNLIAFTLMSNHVHAVLDFSDDNIITKGENNYLPNVLKLIKGGSAYSINRILNRKGPFWAKESYDHMIRDIKSLYRIIHYIQQNPVKAKLVKTWQDWPYTYVHKDFLEYE